jgi:hypothetical protein
MQFLEGVVSQETGLAPDGLSLARVIPRSLVKVLPVALVAFGAFVVRRRRLDIEQSVPFVIGAAVLLLLYPTWAYDYSVPCLFGLIPFAIDWGRRFSVREPAAWLAPGIFILFLAAASTVKIVDALAAADTDIVMIWAYVAVAAVLLTTPMLSAVGRSVHRA